MHYFQLTQISWNHSKTTTFRVAMANLRPSKLNLRFHLEDPRRRNLGSKKWWFFGEEKIDPWNKDGGFSRTRVEYLEDEFGVFSTIFSMFVRRVREGGQKETMMCSWNRCGFSFYSYVGMSDLWDSLVFLDLTRLFPKKNRDTGELPACQDGNPREEAGLPWGSQWWWKVDSAGGLH